MEIREAFGQALLEAGREYKDVVVVSCDLKSATRTKYFFKVFPERSFEVGIAEANGLGISAGLALAGYRPFISSFGAFITGKNVEIRTSIAYNKAPVVIVGTHGGLIGPDGTTQAGIQDITTMRAMPNFVILQPASPLETRQIVKY
jgi:transketolase